jgi:ubiquinone biosynthesis protein UbiJ
MAPYRTPLPQLLATTLEAAVNRVLVLDADSAGRLRKLEKRILRLDIDGLGISLFFTSESGNVRIALQAERDPDTVISGTPFALFAMAAPGDAANWGLPGSRVQISGDANLARDLEEVFSRLDPDWEGPLAGLFGDVVGYQLAAGLKQGVEMIRETAQSTVDMAGAYLREEATTLVRPIELKSFGEDLDKLRAAVDRLEARIRKMQEQEP